MLPDNHTQLPKTVGVLFCLKKSLNAFNPSGHPPVCEDKISSWHLIGFPDGSTVTALFVFLLIPSFVSLEVSLFPSIFVPSLFSLCMNTEITPYVFLFRKVFFYLCDRGLDSWHQLM